MTKEQILQQCIIVEKVVKLPNVQLERKAYLEVKKALEMIGGKWKGGRVQGFVFESDPSDLLDEISKGGKRNLKKEFQYFATPKNLAEKIVALADLKESDTVLEPSAGQGGLVREINKVCGCEVDCYELMDANARILNNSGLRFNLLGKDFLKHGDKKYSKIIANPPFTKNQDIDHLKEMYKLLKVGGRLICITSESWVFGNQKKQVAFREWLNSLDSEILTIERGAFKKSGTMVGGKIIIINN